MSESDFTVIHEHRVRVEGDVVFIQLTKNIDGPQAETLLEFLEGVIARVGRIFLLFDNSVSTQVQPAARRLFMKFVLKGQLQGVANFGGGAIPRTLAFLMINAIRLVFKDAPPQTYVSTEAQARAWIDAARRVPRPA